MAAATTSTCRRPKSRFLRLDLERSDRGAGYAIRNIVVEPYQFASTPNSFFGAIAKDAPRGAYPRYFANEQSYWTVVGVKGDYQRALIDELGRVEPGEGWGSIEPFLYLNDELVTWDDVEAVQALEGGYLPIPTRDLDPAARAARRHGLRDRRARPLVAVAALPGQQHLRRAAGGPAVPRAAPVPGQPALAVARRRRRRDPHPGAGLRPPRGRDRPRADGDPADHARALRRGPLRGRQHHRISAPRASCPSRRRCSTSSATPPARSPSISSLAPASRRTSFSSCRCTRSGPALPDEPTPEDAARLWAEAFDATVAGLAADARSGVDRAAGRRAEDRQHAQVDARLHPDQRRRRRRCSLARAPTSAAGSGTAR